MSGYVGEKGGGLPISLPPHHPSLGLWALVGALLYCCDIQALFPSRGSRFRAAWGCRANNLPEQGGELLYRSDTRA